MENKLELDENIQTALKDLLYGRASMYEFLALIFKEPVKENFKGLSAKFLPVLKNIVQEDDDENLKKGITFLEEYIVYENEKDESELCHIFNKTYTSLFYLGMNSVPATASGAMSPGGTMKQEPWEYVMNIYKRWKFTPPANFLEPEDHLYVQMKFLEKLSTFCASSLDNVEALQSGIKDSLDVINQLLKWSDLFQGLVNKRYLISKYDCKLYLAASYIYNGFLHYDKKIMESVQSQLGEYGAIYEK